MVSDNSPSTQHIEEASISKLQMHQRRQDSDKLCIPMNEDCAQSQRQKEEAINSFSRRKVCVTDGFQVSWLCSTYSLNFPILKTKNVLKILALEIIK